MLSGNSKPPLFLGTFGLGKSYQARAFAEKHGYHYIDYRLSQKTFNDVRGYGVPNRETGKMEFLMDEDLDFVDDKPNLLHYEEVLNAMGAVQKPALQQILDRRCGLFHFPKDTLIMASSNRLSDKAGVERMIASLADRFTIYHVRPDIDSFMDYMERFADPTVLAFLKVNSDAPYNFKMKDWDGESNFPSFRSFEALDKLVKSYGDVTNIPKDNLFPAHAAGCIGPKYGAMFAQFVKLTSKVGDVDKMLENASSCAIPAEPDIRWVIACRLISMTDRKNIDDVLLLAHRLSEPADTSWRMNSQPTTMQTYVATALIKRKPDLQRTIEMLEWQQIFSKELTSC